jgi:hemin uptake protein HemP
MQIRIILNKFRKMHTQKMNAAVPTPAAEAGFSSVPGVRRITSENLLQDKREVEIEHGGKIYRLRITQLNKLILTA